MGGWIAKAGSCNIGFSPVPSDGIGNIFAKGLDVKSINKRKPKIIISWKNNVRVLYLWERFFESIANKNKKIVNTNNHKSKLPSWLPHVPEIL